MGACEALKCWTIAPRVGQGGAAGGWQAPRRKCRAAVPLCLCSRPGGRTGDDGGRREADAQEQHLAGANHEGGREGGSQRAVPGRCSQRAAAFVGLMARHAGAGSQPGRSWWKGQQRHYQSRTLTTLGWRSAAMRPHSCSRGAGGRRWWEEAQAGGPLWRCLAGWLTDKLQLALGPGSRDYRPHSTCCCHHPGAGRPRPARAPPQPCRPPPFAAPA